MLDAATGARKFEFTGAGGTPLVAGGVVYLNASTVIKAFTTAGTLLWSKTKPVRTGVVFGPGAGTALPSLHAGELYITSPYAENATSTARTLALDAKTGKILRTLPPSATPVAFDGTTGIVTTTANNDSTVVSAIHLPTGSVYWSKKLTAFRDGPAVLNQAPPVISNGLVWMQASRDTATPGRLIALDEVSGSTRNTVTQPCPPATGPVVIAQRRILTPSNCGVTTFTETKPPQLLADSGFEVGTSGWTPLPGGALSRVTSPIHRGSAAVRVMPSAASQYTTGITHGSVVRNSVAGRLYVVSCWVRAVGDGLDLRAVVREYSQDLSTEIYQPPTSFAQIPAGTWMQISASGRATAAGHRMIPQVYATGAGANTTATVYDDCSFTSG
ncbi:hypothetical protein ACFUTX_16360 [Microbacterium sp. NPDC057407]|uniref:hypothetical protein n=1 Tax=Microbacterium sp. NPDC057407 TaxID=3346120 RepID=UPI00366CD0AE